MFSVINTQNKKFFFYVIIFTVVLNIFTGVLIYSFPFVGFTNGLLELDQLIEKLCISLDLPFMYYVSFILVFYAVGLVLSEFVNILFYILILIVIVVISMN
jgi:hypothetical protein